MVAYQVENDFKLQEITIKRILCLVAFMADIPKAVGQTLCNPPKELMSLDQCAEVWTSGNKQLHT